ncbi:DUF29 domain-containing protein [Acidithiobacillus sp.]
MTMATARQFEHQTTATLYETDFLAWTEAQAEALRTRQAASLDWVNLLEEVESMGASQRRDLESRLTVLLMHLIKWRWQPEKRSTSWKLTIRGQRREIERLLKQSPSLKGYVPEVLAEAWNDACEDAEDETGLPMQTFPTGCPWDATSQILDKAWWPD